MNNANIFREFFVLSEKWCEMVRKIRQQLSTISNNYFGVVNNYRQLATICVRLFKGSTIIDNWQQLFLGGQQLSTITNNLREVMRSTISNNWQQLFWGGQQLSTITNNLREVMWSTIINHYQQFARGDAVND